MQYLAAVLCALAILTGQFFYGGTLRPVFMLPSYGMLAIAGLLVAAGLFSRRSGGVSWACFISGTAFIVWVSWRCVSAPDMVQAEDFLRLFLACYMAYLVVGFGVTQPAPRLVFVSIIFAGAMAQSVVGVAQFQDMDGAIPKFWFSEQLRIWYEPILENRRFVRAHGTYLNANHLSWFLNTAGLLALALGCLGRFRAWAKILAVYLGVVFIAVGMLCLSRGGILGLACGLAVFVTLCAVAIHIGAPTRRIAMFAILGAALSILVLAVWLVFDQSLAVRFRLERLFDENYRVQVWSVAWRQMQLEPLFGAGPGAFTYYSRQLKNVSGASEDMFAHNDWAQIAADFGFPAIALLVIAVIIHISSSFSGFLMALRQRMAASSLPQSTSAALGAGALASVAAFAVHSFFDFNLQIPANAILAAACAGILVIRSPARPALSIFRFSIPVAALATAVGLIALGWHGRSQIHALRAENHLLRGEFLSGREEAERGLRIDARSAQLHRLLGDAFMLSGNDQASATGRVADYDRALEEVRLAAQLDPRNSRNHLFLAQAFLNVRQPKKAAEASVEAIRLDPRRASGYEMYGLSSEGGLRFAAALRAYETAMLLEGKTFGRERYRALLEPLKKRAQNDTKK